MSARPEATIDFLQDHGISLEDCKRMQPNLAAWVNSQRATFLNIAKMENWALNIPSACKKFSLMDCILLGSVCKPSRMLNLGLSLDVLLTVYKMELHQMSLFPYTMQDWVTLGLDFESHCQKMDHNTFLMIFKTDPNTGSMMYNRIMESKQQSVPNT